MQINTHFQQLPNNYLFKEITYRVEAFEQAHPEARVRQLLEMCIDLRHGFYII